MNWDQLRIVLWLRWRLSRNQMARAGAFNTFLTALALAGWLVAVVGGGVGGLLLGWLGLARVKPIVVLVAWDVAMGAFLVFWTLGILTEIQRSESIDFSRLLHLPVSLKQVFFLNYVASHLTLSVTVAGPFMLGLGIGLAASRGGHMLLVLLPAGAVLGAVTAWTYCLRGWLVALMVNPRRRRAIVMGVTTAVILLLQLPNLYFNVLRRDRHRTPDPEPPRSKSFEMPGNLRAAHYYLPPLWVGHSAQALAAERNPWPALGGALGGLGLGAWGLRRAHRATLRFYQGQTHEKPAIKSPPPPRVSEPHRVFLEVELPGIPGPAAALALASIRSMLRAPEVKMSLGSAVVMLAIFGSMMFLRQGQPMPEAAKPFLVSAAVLFSLFPLLQILTNQFGFDRDGFRALVLCPASRRDILLGKNLACFPFVGGVGVIYLLLLAWSLRVSAVALVAGLIQLLAAYLLVCLVGNTASILLSHRIAAGSLKPTKSPVKILFATFLFHLVFPVLVMPVFVPPALGLLSEWRQWLPATPVNLVASLVILLVLVCVYRLALRGLGELLQRQETAILQVVTQEVE